MASGAFSIGGGVVSCTGGVVSGGVVSGAFCAVTVTLKEACAVLPALSVLVHVTVVSPMGNVVPDSGLHVTVSVPSTLSVAVGLVYVTAAPEAPVASTVMFVGTFSMVGGVASLTVILKEACEVFPAGSFAEHSTVVSPSGNVEPDAGVHSTTISPVLLSGSVAVTV